MKLRTIAPLTFAVLPAFVQAQEARIVEDLQLEIIVVKGQKLTQSLQEVTSSVAVTTGAEISREPIVTLYDIVSRVPNVTDSFGGLGFAIRGVDQRGIAGSGSTLTVYVDDSPLGNQTTFFGPLDSWDLSQVEVYRGPQSTNFGRNTLAGAIYVRSEDPTYDWSLKLRGEAGDNGVLQSAVAGGGGLIEDRLAFRLAANYRESDGFIHNSFLDEEADATELKTARLKFLIEPSENLDIVTTSSYTENYAGEDRIDPTNGIPGMPLDAKDVERKVSYDTPGLEGTDTFIQSINATWTLSNSVDIQSITTYQDTDYTRREDFDGTEAAQAALDRTGSDEAVSQELRLRYLGERLQGTLGVYYYDNDDGFKDSFVIPATVVSPALPASILISRVSEVNNQATNYAAFLDGSYALNGRFDLIFGLRYDNEESSSQSTAITETVDPLPAGFEFLAPLLGEDSSEFDADYDAWLPKVGIRWVLDDSTNLSFVAQKAYRAGGAQILTLDGSVNTFEPEYLWNYEIAVRSVFLDGRLHWNSNFYYSDWEDQQVSEPIPDFPTFFTTVNAGESTLYGFETEVSYSFSESIEVYGGVGYAKTEFDFFPNSSFDPDQPESEFNQENYDGNSFPFAPEWSLNLGVDYSGASGWFGGVDMNYQSDAYQENENYSVNKFGNRLLVNARIGYAIQDNLRLSVYARNLLDEQYFTSLSVATPGAEFSRMGDERTVAMRLEWEL